jgi:hypothetical protein
VEPDALHGVIATKATKKATKTHKEYFSLWFFVAIFVSFVA